MSSSRGRCAIVASFAFCCAATACGAPSVAREQPPFPSAALDPPPYTPPPPGGATTTTPTDRATSGEPASVALPGPRTAVRERLAWFTRALAGDRTEALRRGFAEQVVLIGRRRVVPRDDAVAHVRRGAAELRQLGVNLDVFFDLARAGSQRASAYFGNTVPQPMPEGLSPDDHIAFAPVRTDAIVAPTFPGVAAGLGNLSLVLAMRFEGDDIRIVGVAP